MSKKIIIMLLVVIAAGGYWYTTQQSKDGGESTASVSTILERVPADTVFFLGGLETIPSINPYDPESISALKASTEDTLKQIELLLGGSGSPALTMLMGLYQHGMDQVYSSDMTEMPDFAFYGLGIYPVTAWESADVKAFSELLNRIETEKGISSRSFKLGNAELREYQIQDGVPFKMYISINGDIVSVGALGENQDFLNMFAGIELPEQNLSSTDKLQNLSSKHKLLPYGIFYFDLDTAMTNIASTEDNLLKQSLQEVSNGSAMKQIESDVCFDDAAKIFANWPRVVFGYKSLDIKSDPMVMEAAFIIENTDSKFLKSLKGIMGTLPDFSLEGDILSLGYGINVDNIASFVTEVRQDIIQQTYQCPTLVEMQQKVKQSNPGMIAMGTQMVSGLQGVGVHLTNIDIAAVTAGDMSGVEGMAIIVAKNPKNLLMAGGTFYPPLSEMSIEANGESQPIALPLPVEINANISMSDSVLALQIGGSEENNNRISEFHKGQALSTSLFRMGMDFSTYFKMLEPLLSGALTQVSTTDAEQMKNMVAVFEKMDIKFVYEFNVEDNGLITSIKFSMKNISEK